MQQAITWTDVDRDLCHHMASLGPDELNIRKKEQFFIRWQWFQEFCTFIFFSKITILQIKNVGKNMFVNILGIRYGETQNQFLDMVHC